MWVTAPLERNKDGKIEFVDHEAINLYVTEEAARKQIASGLRSGYELMGLFTAEGIYDADLSVRKVKT
jgi:hypothetical protein